jgi:multiple sugar transport system substrate-binding protein
MLNYWETTYESLAKQKRRSILMKKGLALFLTLIMLSLTVLGCGGTPEPEVIVETVEVKVVETVEVEVPVEVPVEAGDKTVVEFWTTDNEEDRVDVYEAIADRIMADYPELDVRIVAIEEAGVTQRMATALAANRPPDLIRMGVERVAAFAADGILDEAAAAAVIQAVGEDDFRDGPLAMATNPATGNRAAVPYDGWIQAIWYRKDVFDSLGLAAPTTWDSIQAACEALPGTAFSTGIELERKISGGE